MDSDGEEFADEYLAEESGILVNYYNGGRLAGAPSAVPPVGNNPNGYVLIIILGIPTWGALPTPTQTYELISTQVASSSSTITFTGLSSTYFLYHVFWHGVYAGTSNARFRVRISDNGGSSYKTSNYYNTTDVTTTTYIAPQGAMNFPTGSTAAGWGELKLFNPSQSSVYPTIMIRSYADTNNQQVGYARYLTAQAYDAIQFTMSSGNFTAGTWKLYGVRA